MKQFVEIALLLFLCSGLVFEVSPEPLENDSFDDVPLSSDESISSIALHHLHDVSALFLSHGYPFLPKDTPLNVRLALEENTWHWYPWRKTDPQLERIDEEHYCPPGSSIDDFPEDIFTNEQRLNGAIILHFICALYCFTLMGLCINNYFIPSIHIICELLKIPPDLGAAVFMATGTAMPELFTNIISTFIAESDMGLGNIIGSLMFNILGVAGISCFFAIKTIDLNWWPITRDSLMFTFNVSFLIGFAWDGQVYWYESMILVILIPFYYTVMVFNKRIQRVARRLVEDRMGCCNNSYDMDPKTETVQPVTDVTIESGNVQTITKSEEAAQTNQETNNTKIVDSPAYDEPTESINIKTRLFEVPSSCLHITWWLYSWPGRFLLFITVPNPKIFRKLFPLTFLMCILYIAVISYMIFWMLTIIGYTFNIPESVMGMTFQAIGGCTSELLTAVIMARKGDGSFGVSNSLGASTLSILLSLGLPWFMRSIIDKSRGDKEFVMIDSYGIQWTILSLLGVVATLYLVVSLSGYKLKKKVGIILIFAYLSFLTFGVLIEVDVILPSGRPC